MKNNKRKLKRKKQKIHNQRFNKNSTSKLRRLIIESKPMKTVLMEEFVIELSSKLELKPLDFKPFIRDINVSVKHGEHTYTESKLSRTLNYQCDKYKLIFSEHDNQTVELWWIQVYDKGNGLGTEIMNKILNVSNELGIRVRVIPVDIDNKEKKLENLNRLRDWYKSFGFQTINFNRTPELYYEPQKEQLRQVS